MVVGGANWDRTWVLPALPAAGETVVGELAAEGPGGKGFNIAVGVSRLDEGVALVARVGDDDAGRRLLAALDEAGVDGSGVVIAPGELSGAAAVWLAAGESTIAVGAGANAGLGAEEVEAALERCGEDCALVVLQAEASDAALLAAEAWVGSRRARDTPRPGRRPQPRVLLSPSPVRELPPQVWAVADLVIVSRVEAASLTGLTVGDPLDAEDAALALLERGPSVAVVTLGSEGAVVARGERATYLPPYTVDAVDPTGAGDAACAALARGTVAGLDVFAATGYAMAAAAFCVGRRGAAAAMPTLDEVDRMVHSVDLRRDEGTAPVRLLDLR